VARKIRTSVIIDGGDGDDDLIAGGGRSVLIGGAGSDVLSAGRSGTLLIGASTMYDTNDQALREILTVWSSNQPLRTRITALSGRSRQRHDGKFVLNTSALSDDGSRDVLVGDSKRDWIVALDDDVVIDRNPGTRHRMS
jgi:Ca2+-binding RTX toxin-like protein